MSEADGDLQASPAPAAPLVLFDGVCNFCDAAVDFILARDRSGRFRFASLQGSTARGLAERIGPLPATPNSIVLVTGAIIYTESSAALRILAGLGGCWCLALGLLVVPAAGVPVGCAQPRSLGRQTRHLSGTRAARAGALARLSRFKEQTSLGHRELILIALFAASAAKAVTACLIRRLEVMIAEDNRARAKVQGLW